ncbi:complex I subunit 5 family protein [Qiania dongpingensis]|uniref:Sodium:proton antiporter n=1 Tax=Qiania dongpingensis TaxID=2763669 RepID=A0A7G9G3V5_9FIRM|nr:proton-conducting transporter membrane subunit [Qiania dongpingensis]QNM05487.1 sodium:proton antiporter [Qiania dongpingensis]
MDFVCNFPFFSIILAMFCGILSSVLKGPWAKRLCLFMVTAVLVMSAAVLAYTMKTGTSYTYSMGHFPAPWGNEIRAGVLEALTATGFSVIMLLSLLGGMSHIFTDVEETKTNLFFILVDLLMSSLLALIYTNDLFTAYVFVEINTIAACGLIMIKQDGHGIVAAIRYMVMSLLGSGMFLISLSMLYDITGHLLMEPAKEAVGAIVASGSYEVPLLVVIALMSVGLAIKSGLYPFHSWIPETYGYATPAASAILSSLVSKGYIFLLIKVFYRVLGYENVVSSKVINALFVFGLVGMIVGSVKAIKQTDTRKMIAYSSVAQIGYIYMGIGLGTKAGMAAAVFHIFTHAATKSLLFISAVGLYEVSDGKADYRSLRGSGYRNRTAGIAFAVGALSMVGFPMLSGFISKLMFATAAVQSPHKMVATILGLAVSTILNAIYFLRLVISIYSPAEREYGADMSHQASGKLKVASLLFIIVNLVLGLFSQPIVNAIDAGLSMFV